MQQNSVFILICWFGSHFIHFLSILNSLILLQSKNISYLHLLRVRSIKIFKRQEVNKEMIEIKHELSGFVQVFWRDTVNVYVLLNEICFLCKVIISLQKTDRLICFLFTISLLTSCLELTFNGQKSLSFH